MKIGFLSIDRRRGIGVYQYSLNVIRTLKKMNKHEYIIFDSNPNNGSALEAENMHRVSIKSKENIVNDTLRTIGTMLNMRFILGNCSTIKNSNLDLLISIITTDIGYHVGVPYLICIHDLMHKYYPNLPEFSGGRILYRDMVYSKSARNSVFTIVDSSQGKEDLVTFYKIPERKIKIIPYVPPPYIYENKNMNRNQIEQLLVKYKLPDKYLFYPAQLWSHKNHARLLKSLSLLKEEHKLEIPLVLTGSRKESYKEIMLLINKLKMNNQIFYLEYVSDLELTALYKKSTALVYPSLFGPTNIPILEAMVLGVPVICSILFSMPEQIGNAGLLFDPFDVKDMAEKIYTVWENEKLRDDMINKGYNKIKDITLENHLKQWEQVIEESLKILGNS